MRIVIAEDNVLVRSGLEALLSDIDDFAVVASSGSLDQLLDAVETERPDIVLTDIRMPPTHTDEGIRAATALRSSHPEVAVVVLSQFADAELALQLVGQGSERRGYLLKDRLGNVDDLTRALHTVAAGGSFIDPTVVDSLMAARARHDNSALHRLTTREREVLGEMATGGSNAVVAERLFISERAVEKHINSIFSKLELTDSSSVHRRVTAVLMLLRDGT